MFARWSQENFFKYARENFGLDRLVDYHTEVISDPIRVVNPDYRHLDGQVRSLTGKLTRRLATFAAMTLQEPIEPKHVEPFMRRKVALQEEIETLQHALDALKAKRKETPHHIMMRYHALGHAIGDTGCDLKGHRDIGPDEASEVSQDLIRDLARVAAGSAGIQPDGPVETARLGSRFTAISGSTRITAGSASDLPATHFTTGCPHPGSDTAGSSLIPYLFV